jgi:hypothetical protein
VVAFPNVATNRAACSPNANSLNFGRLSFTVSLALRASASPHSTLPRAAIPAESSLSLNPVFAMSIFCERCLIPGPTATGLQV